MLGESIKQIIDGIVSEYKFYDGCIGVPANEVVELLAQLIKLDRMIDEVEYLDYGMRFSMAQKMLSDSITEIAF